VEGVIDPTLEESSPVKQRSRENARDNLKVAETKDI
jgi:hypothetical protein